MARTTPGPRRRLRRRGREGEVATEPPAARDLDAIVGEHLIPEDQHGATSQWHPMRRGNSPHHRR